MSINEIESKARELRQLQALIDEATAEARSPQGRDQGRYGRRRGSPRRRVQNHMEAGNGLPAGHCGTEKALPDVAERFTKQSTTRRFCVA